MNLSRLLLTAAALGGLATSSALAQGTAFTYQGRLDDGGTPATGVYNLKFSLHNAATGGGIVGTALTNAPVGVTNGLFTVTLDFGLSPFDGSARWLEIGVSPNGATVGHTVLSPRQAVTATPYALRATTAGTATSVTAGGITTSQLANSAVNSAIIADGSIRLADLGSDVGVWTRSGLNISYSGGNVGIGTTAPNAQLQVSDGTTNGNMVLQALTGLNSGYEFLGFNGYHNSGEIRFNPAKARYRLGADQRGSADLFFIDTFETNNVGHVALGITSKGNVGIGTTTPIAPLEVSGVGAAPSLTANNPALSVRSSPHFIGLNFGHYPSGSFASWIQSQRTSDSSTWGLALNPLGGNVGIGTAFPFFPFQVRAGLNMNLLVEAASGAVGIRGINDANTASIPIQIYGPRILLHGGNVGIGTDNPTTRLHVDGEVTCTAVNITSDRNAKEGFKPVNAREVLEKVARLPITEWQYKSQSGARHIGPMAQDFHEAFTLGHDEKHIATVDEGGVALAAIQGLNEKLEEKTREVEELKKSVTELRELMDRLARASRN